MPKSPDESVKNLVWPETLPSEDRPLIEAAEQFLRSVVLPSAQPHGFSDPSAMPELFQRAAHAGLLGLDVPEEYGGLGLAWHTSVAISQALGAEPSFAIGQSVHGGVASLPILLFGTEEQKRTWLPQLAEGRRIGAFALTEAHAGSDIGALRTKAVPNPEGWTLSGEKMWITNAAFAGLFTVFAQTPEGLSAFLVPRETPGLTVEREERKVGLKGSSTCRITLENVQMSPSSLLGESGSGARIALTTLNLGRLKLSATALGIAKRCLDLAIAYVKERTAFGRTLAELPLTQATIGQMAAHYYAAESALYVTAARLERKWVEDPKAASTDVALECALLKPLCTDALWLCADLAVQLHGGYGFSEEFEVARLWRDARVFRIFEGTNEVCRLSAARMLATNGAEVRDRLGFGKAGSELEDALVHLRDCTITDSRQVEMVRVAKLAENLFASGAVTSRWKDSLIAETWAELTGVQGINNSDSPRFEVLGRHVLDGNIRP